MLEILFVLINAGKSVLLALTLDKDNCNDLLLILMEQVIMSICQFEFLK